MTAPMSEAAYVARIDFMVELASRLHRYGTTAERLEGAIVAVASRLGLGCEPWSNPTGLILTFTDPGRATGLRDITRVLRLSPGDVDLHRLVESDRIAEEVLEGRLDVDEARVQLRALDAPAPPMIRRAEVVAFGLAAAAVAGLLRLPWLDIGVAGATGLMIGLLDLLAERHPRVRAGFEALAGMLAGATAVVVGSFIGPLNQNTVIIVSLIVLLPGLTLTNAVNELTGQQLVSGTARFAGALTTVLKLAVGVLVAVYALDLIGLDPPARGSRPQPPWMEWVALAVASFAFAVLFRASVRDYLRVMAAAATGYLISRFVGEVAGSPAGVFVAALSITALGNAYARWWHRPGAIIRVPGIITLVPGSTSMRGLLNLMQTQDMGAGQAAMVTVINVLAALVAGLLFGNLLLPSRRNL
ncbi:threonine/serine exporter family protein [Lysobacter sp. TY2-98]|uniref:threonine/serine ThrE exporter family protein n=1 Tax=Lysobacter sp. TY2-98 TaxID=2290922 RepID=UPI000E2036EB|nr:threonine/serine exporter family protein [Lysobacter sp. TY2-98]AXK70909.1 threonine/serine exporter family protein [Lysobacter sp. TY2-98]